MIRTSSGIAELDLILGGGFAPGSCVVVAGAPGSGKTILAQQICFARASAEHPSIYYSTLSEPQSKLISHLEGLSFFDPSAIGAGVLYHHLAAVSDHTGDTPISVVSVEVARQALDRHAGVIVIDSSKALHQTNDEGFRRAIYEIASRVAHTDAILVLVGEYDAEEMMTAPEFAVADVIILLSNEAAGLTDQRWLRVHKHRGSDYLAGRHAFMVGSQGIKIFPRPESIILPVPASPEHRLTTGTSGLDTLMNGGIPALSTSVLAGPSGAGKTILALQFVAAGLEQGEACVYVSFQESEERLRAKARHFGWEFGGPAARDRLVIVHVQPPEIGLDAVAARIWDAVASVGARRVVIDSISELERAGDDRIAHYLWALVAGLLREGATVILTSESDSFFGPAFEITHGLSFIADNVVLLRYLELDSELRRALAGVKMRDSAPVKSLVEFEITGSGAVIKGKFAGISGVLSGAPVPAEQKLQQFFGR